MTLKEQLEQAADRYDEAGDTNALVSKEDCRTLLGLLKAAKDFHEAYGEVDSDNWYSCRDTLLNAIHAVEGA